MVCEPVCEPSCLLQVVLLEIGRRDLDAEVALAVGAGPEIAQERKQGADLAALVTEVDAAGESSAVLGGESPHGFQVVAPVPAAAHSDGERLSLQYLVRRVGLQERADRYVC